MLKSLPEHPFVLRLFCTFQSRDRLFFVTEFLPGGELFSVLGMQDRMREESARFYLAEMVLAIEHLHRNDVIFRYTFAAFF